jgi:hypothetical protein
MSAFLGLDPDAYAFEWSAILSRNEKVGDVTADPSWTTALAAMRDAGRLKGYLASGAGQPAAGAGSLSDSA